MYAGIVLFILFVTMKEQLRSCKADMKVESQREETISQDDFLDDMIFKMIIWRQKFEKKMTIMENNIRRIHHTLLTYIEREKLLINGFLHLQKSVLKNNDNNNILNNNIFNKITMYDILCFIGKYRYTQ